MNNISDSVMYEYRLYYDDAGNPIRYSMQSLEGNYITVTRDQYVAARMDIVVRNREIISKRNFRRVAVYEKNSSGIKTSKYDINILLSDDDVAEHNFWKLTEYDLNR